MTCSRSSFIQTASTTRRTLNATRSSRYRYNVLEVRNAFDITVLKARGVYRWRVPWKRPAGRIPREPADRSRSGKEPVPTQSRDDEHPPARSDAEPDRPRVRQRPVPSLRQVDQRVSDGNLGNCDAATAKVARFQGARSDRTLWDRSRASPISRTCSTRSSVFVGSSCPSARTTSICRSGIPSATRSGTITTSATTRCQTRRSRARTRTRSTTATT